MSIKIGKFEIKPEVENPVYYLHILILVFIVLVILNFGFNHNMLNFGMFWKLSLAVTISDIFAHTVLKLD